MTGAGSPGNLAIRHAGSIPHLCIGLEESGELHGHQRTTDAGMAPGAKCEVTPPLALDPEAVRIGEGARIAICGCEHEQHDGMALIVTPPISIVALAIRPWCWPGLS